MSTTISDKTHDRMIHKLDQLGHELEAVANDHEKGLRPRLHLEMAQAKLDGAREIFGIFNGNI
jgi:hypothetical protein